MDNCAMFCRHKREGKPYVPEVSRPVFTNK